MTTILVIDNKGDSQGLVSAMRGNGLRVLVEVESGNGLRRAVEEIPSVIILDENMPPIDGWELLPILRSFTDALIVVKGSGGELAITQAVEDGADAYLPPCISVNEILVRIHAILRRSRTVRKPNADWTAYEPIWKSDLMGQSVLSH